MRRPWRATPHAFRRPSASWIASSSVNMAYLRQLPAKKKFDRKERSRQPGPTLQQRIGQLSRHPLQWGDRRVSCPSCLKSSTFADALGWVATQCEPAGQPETGRRVRALPAGFVGTVRGAMLHPSHSLSTIRGVLFCTRCGYYTTRGTGSKSSPRNLAVPCTGVATSVGKTHLNRLARDLPPRAGMQWPG